MMKPYFKLLLLVTIIFLSIGLYIIIYSNSKLQLLELQKDNYYYNQGNINFEGIRLYLEIENAIWVQIKFALAMIVSLLYVFIILSKVIIKNDEKIRVISLILLFINLSIIIATIILFNILDKIDIKKETYPIITKFEIIQIFFTGFSMISFCASPIEIPEKNLKKI